MYGVRSHRRLRSVIGPKEKKCRCGGSGGCDLAAQQSSLILAPGPEWIVELEKPPPALEFDWRGIAARGTLTCFMTLELAGLQSSPTEIEMDKYALAATPPAATLT